MLSFVLWLSGCVSSVKVSTLVTNPEDASELVIVRPSAFPMGIYAFNIEIDGTEMLSIGSNEYAKLHIDEGMHQLKVSCMGLGDEIKFETTKEEPTFIVVSPKVGFMANRIKAVVVPKIRVKNTLKKAKRIGAE